MDAVREDESILLDDGIAAVVVVDETTSAAIPVNDTEVVDHVHMEPPPVEKVVAFAATEESSPPLQQQQQQLDVESPSLLPSSTTKSLSLFPNTKSKLKSVISRAVHNVDSSSQKITSMKEHTKHAAQRTSQSVSTAMHHMTDQIRNKVVQQQQKRGKEIARTTTTTTEAQHNHKTMMMDTTKSENSDTTYRDDHNYNNVEATTNESDHGQGSNNTLRRDMSSTPTASVTKPSETNATLTSSTTTTPFTIGPLLEFITADFTLIFIFTFSAACYPLYEHYNILFINPGMLSGSSNNDDLTTTTTVTPLFILSRIAVPWMIAAFTLGLAIGQFVSTDILFKILFSPFSISEVATTKATTTLKASTVIESIEGEEEDYDENLDITIDNVLTDTIDDDDSRTKNKKHALFMTLLGSNRSARIRFHNDHHRSSRSTVINHKKFQPVQKVWTTLTRPRDSYIIDDDAPSSTLTMTSTTSMTDTTNNKHRSKQKQKRFLPWQRHITPSSDGYLMQHLLQHESFRRIITIKQQQGIPIPTSNAVAPDDPPNSDTTLDGMTVNVPQEQPTSQQPPQVQLGSFNLKDSVADTLDDYVITPLFTLRGMDIFLSGDDNIQPEMESSTHPYLIENGLRSVPTFIVNVLTQWGNILIYFEMPSWVHSFNMIVDESDPDDVKALKRFLNGDSVYRNDRLKMIPSLVDGPMPIRMMAPPKREKVVNCDWMPIVWNQHDREISSDGSGTILYPILEATLDCMTSRTIRSMAGLVKKYLHLLSVDAAIVIGTPDRQLEPEPSACLGLWRFNHIDISLCPHLPDRYQVEEGTINAARDYDENLALAADIQRASLVVQAMQ